MEATELSGFLPQSDKRQANWQVRSWLFYISPAQTLSAGQAETKSKAAMLVTIWKGNAAARLLSIKLQI